MRIGFTAVLLFSVYLVSGQINQNDYAVRCIRGGLEVVNPYSTACGDGQRDRYLFEFYYGIQGSRPDLYFPFSSDNNGNRCETTVFIPKEVLDTLRRDTNHKEKIFTLIREGFDCAVGCGNTSSPADDILIIVDLDDLPQLEVDLGPDVDLCPGETTEIEAGPFFSYAWNTGDTSSFMVVDKEGMYSVTVSDGGGCIGSDSVAVYVQDVPEISISAEKDTLCIGDPLRLDALGAENRGYWLSPFRIPGYRDTIRTTTIAIDSATIRDWGWWRYVFLSPEIPCPLTDSLFMMVIPSPVVVMDDAYKICRQSDLQLIPYINSSDPVLTYRWTTPGGNSFARDLAIGPEQVDSTLSGPFTLEVTDSYGCSQSYTTQINVVFCCTDESVDLYIPTGFSPNDDGLNDLFMVYGPPTTTIQRFLVFDRWGDRVHYAENFPAGDTAAGWDGRGAKPGYYTYLAELECRDEMGNRITLLKKGGVTLIK